MQRRNVKTTNADLTTNKKENIMKDFETLKKEILRRAKDADACVKEYTRALKSETYAELMQVIKANFWWCCVNNIINEEIISEYKDEFNANKIYLNESRDSGYLLVTDNIDKIGGNCEAAIIGNAVVNEVYGNATIDYVYDNAVIERVFGKAVIEDVSDNAVIDKVVGNAFINNVYDNAVINEVYVNAVINKVSGNAVIEDVYGNAVIKDVCDNAVIERVSGNAKIIKDFR